MFYCKECGDKNNWPDRIFKSVGSCEVCGRTARCSDVKSSELPPKIEKPEVAVGSINDEG